MTGSVYDVDLDPFIVDSSIFAQDRDPALPLDIAGVHDPFLYSLVLTENAALPEQSVHQGRLAVVDVGDDRNISYIFSFLQHSYLLFICFHTLIS